MLHRVLSRNPSDARERVEFLESSLGDNADKHGKDGNRDESGFRDLLTLDFSQCNRWFFPA